MKVKQGVSVIICCYNSSEKLPETLAHLARQKCAVPWEIILVDNKSEDGTSVVAKTVWDKYTAPLVKFEVIYEPVAGQNFARRKGVNAAQYEYLIFCDDDNWLDENYVQNVFDSFASTTGVTILGGIGEPVFENEFSKPVWFDKFHHGYAVGPQAGREGIVNGVYGAGLAIRKISYLETIGKYPMFLTGRKGTQLPAGDDSEICFRVQLAGHKIWYAPQLTFKHFLSSNRLTWQYLKKLHTGFAKTFVILDIYEKALNSSKKLPAFYWLKKSFYYFGIYIKYWPKQYSKYKNGEGTIEELHHIVWKVIAASYLSYNFKTQALHNTMLTLKKNSLQ